MDSMNNQQLLDDVKGSGADKKTYRRPSVQVYGTLSQITQATPNTAPHALDPNSDPTKPASQQGNNRT